MDRQELQILMFHICGAGIELTLPIWLAITADYCLSCNKILSNKSILFVHITLCGNIKYAAMHLILTRKVYLSAAIYTLGTVVGYKVNFNICPKVMFIPYLALNFKVSELAGLLDITICDLCKSKRGNYAPSMKMNSTKIVKFISFQKNLLKILCSYLSFAV